MHVEALERRMEWLRTERQRLEDAYRRQRELNDALLAIRSIGQAEMMKRVRSQLEGVKLRSAEKILMSDTRPFGTRVSTSDKVKPGSISNSPAGSECAIGCTGGDWSWGRP